MVRCTMNVMLPILVQLAPAVIPIFTNHFKDGQSIQQGNFKNGSIARKVSEATNQGKGQAAALAVLLKIDVPDYARSTGKHNCFSGKSPHPGSVPTGL